MQVLKTQLKDEMAELFRKKAMESFGHSKGAISKALNEAISNWLKNKKARKGTVTLEELRGIIKDLKYSSMQAQKEAVNLMGKVD